MNEELFSQHPSEEAVAAMSNEELQNSDWRLFLISNLLQSFKKSTLELRPYTPASKRWEHEHCQLCMERISLYNGELHEGYYSPMTTEWVCPQCFFDFTVLFHWRAAASMPGYAYTYDALGNITSITDQDGKVKTYTYDSQSRLIRADDEPAGKSFTYAYNASANLTAWVEYAYTTGAPGAPTASYDYGRDGF